MNPSTGGGGGGGGGGSGGGRGRGAAPQQHVGFGGQRHPFPSQFDVPLGNLGRGGGGRGWAGRGRGRGGFGGFDGVGPFGGFGRGRGGSDGFGRGAPAPSGLAPVPTGNSGGGGNVVGGGVGVGGGFLGGGGVGGGVAGGAGGGNAPAPLPGLAGSGSGSDVALAGGSGSGGGSLTQAAAATGVVAAPSGMILRKFREVGTDLTREGAICGMFDRANPEADVAVKQSGYLAYSGSVDRVQEVANYFAADQHIEPGEKIFVQMNKYSTKRLQQQRRRANLGKATQQLLEANRREGEMAAPGAGTAALQGAGRGRGTFMGGAPSGMFGRGFVPHGSSRRAAKKRERRAVAAAAAAAADEEGDTLMGDAEGQARGPVTDKALDDIINAAPPVDMSSFPRGPLDEDLDFENASVGGS